MEREKPNISCQSVLGIIETGFSFPLARSLTEHYPGLDTLDPRTEAVQVRIPTAKSGISLGRTIEPTNLGREGGGGALVKLSDPSFKWGLKTGHFYRFIRTFRTSWLPLARIQAILGSSYYHSFHHQNAKYAQETKIIPHLNIKL